MQPTDWRKGFARGGEAGGGWPLWAKIALPIVSLTVVGGVVAAAGSNEQQQQIAPLVDLAGVDAASTSTIGRAESTTTTATTILATTVAPTTIAAATTAAPVTVARTSPAPVVQPPAPATDPRFGTCKEAKAHGLGPYVQGVDPEYSWYRDADHDGIVCE